MKTTQQPLIFFSIDDCLIQVGKDAKSNDRLSLCTSCPDEWWMHWEGGAGAHVVICSRDDFIRTTLPETLKDAATLALRHSKAVLIDNKTYNVTMTRPCYLQKPRGAKDGMVQIVDAPRSTKDYVCRKKQKQMKRK
jgi:predicted ribosome quality control (RQC) complex YloA/Tae2 family protein